MFVPAEKIEPTRRSQLYNNHVAEDAAQKRREIDDRWLNKALDWIAAIVRRART